jgi:hypothetical protein
MEEIVWLIYKILLMDLNKKGINEIMRLVRKIEIVRVMVFIVIIFVFGIIGWLIQNHYNIFVDNNDIFRVIGQALVTLVPFVGTMVIFGLGRIDRRKEEIEDLENNGVDSEYFQKEKDNLDKGTELGRDLMLKFSIYTFLVVILNLFCLLFSSRILASEFVLAVIFSDIVLVGYSFYLVIKIVGRIF